MASTNWRLSYIPQSRVYSTFKNKRSTLTAEDEQADFANRKEVLFSSGKTVYPLLAGVTPEDSCVLRVQEFCQRYNDIEHSAEPVKTEPITVRGRVRSIRRSGKGLIFLDVVQDLQKLQVVVNRKRIEDLSNEQFVDEHSLFRRGDHVSATGRPWRTRSGELSLLADRKLELLSPCLHPLPTNLKDATTRNHNRVVDLAVNADARSVVLARSSIIAFIRQFLQERRFLEVQTPMISSHAGGAAAEPFLTRSRALSSDGKEVELSLRIAPELWLKRMVVSGFDKVFEIGQCFRNEGIDATHNPEFTTCELYQSHATLDDLIQLTEDMLRGVIGCVKTSHPEYTQRMLELEEKFAPTFKRLDFIEDIQKQTGIPLPENLEDLSSLVNYFDQLNIPVDTAADVPKLLDTLAEVYLEPQCTEPTFIVNHPTIMAPLAKSTTITDSNGMVRNISRRFELFIQQKEFVNAYEEENSPLKQRQNFQKTIGWRGPRRKLRPCPRMGPSSHRRLGNGNRPSMHATN
jgi:lysyl-tRNA synthetase class 2